MKKGAEANIYITDWYGRKAITKVRVVKTYLHKSLDSEIRKRRTFQEAHMLSVAKSAGVISPFVYFIDPVKCEIVMEFIPGKNAKEIMNDGLSRQMGKYVGLLHMRNIVHGDLTTSNFIVGNRLVLVDFGLSFYSERLEDKAVDLRLIKEVYNSAHFALFESLFENFLTGYSDIMTRRGTRKVLEKVADIERRGRYAPHLNEPEKFRQLL
ncbi:MAG TPA: KEOPS complex kinase/ATPase Bud32 [Candidatus Nitrosopolaris sp.]|nr:KEOPS complex kinase/ATPase Bud32 [Candidatus Nitrosopolaris sp.]